jgi:hypothetical protein
MSLIYIELFKKYAKKPITNGTPLSLKFPTRTYDIGTEDEKRHVRMQGNGKRLHSIVKLYGINK